MISGVPWKGLESQSRQRLVMIRLRDLGTVDSWMRKLSFENSPRRRARCFWKAWREGESLVVAGGFEEMLRDAGRLKVGGGESSGHFKN